MTALSIPLLLFAAAALAAGGLVKGVIGIGLPIVTVALLSSLLPVPLVLALVVAPIVLTNLWQALHAGSPLDPLRRFWPMILCLLVFIWLSAAWVVALSPRALYGVVGAAVVLFTLTSSLRPSWRLSPRQARWLAPVAGTLGGVLGGLSTMWGPPMMMYFVMLRLPKEEFIRAVGLVWFAGSVPLVLAYVDNGILTPETGALSLAGAVPAFAGQVVGQWLRHRVDQELFYKLVLGMLFLVGLNLLRRALA